MQRRQRQILSQFLGLTLGLFAIWIMLSGQLETKFLLIGFFSSLAISYVCFPLLMIGEKDGEKEFFVFGVNYLKLFLYSLWLMGEIFKASIDVAKEILKPHMDYEPRVVHFHYSYPWTNYTGRNRRWYLRSPCADKGCSRGSAQRRNGRKSCGTVWRELYIYADAGGRNYRYSKGGILI